LKKIPIVLFFFFLFLYAQPSFVSKALKLKLYEKPYWLLLIHNADKSSLLTDTFYLSKNFSPKNELIATIQKRKTYLCKYPARYLWLGKYLKFDISGIKKCKDYKFADKVKDIKFIFTSYRYNSAGSIFGHTFLKIETKDKDYAVNYAAKIPENENILKYIYKGVSGKYTSQYKLMNYSFKEIEYTQEEFRDVFEIKLNLTPEEIKNIVYHLSELKNVKFKYYYFDQNCASEILKLLDYRNQNSTLRKNLKSVTLPVDDVYILKKHGLISGIKREESVLRIFDKLVSELDSNEKKILKKYLNNKLSTDDIMHKKIKHLKTFVQAARKYMEIKTTIDQKFSTTYTTKVINLYKTKIPLYSEKAKVLQRFPFSDRYHKIEFSLENGEPLYGFRWLYRTKYDLYENTKGDVRVIEIKGNKRLESLVLLDLNAEPVSNEFFMFPDKELYIGFDRKFYSEMLYFHTDYKYGYKFEIQKNIYLKLQAVGGVYINNGISPMLGVLENIEFKKNKLIAGIKFQQAKYINHGNEYQNEFTLHYKITQNSNVFISLKRNSALKDAYSNTVGMDYLF
jgi:hypothetical protein